MRTSMLLTTLAVVGAASAGCAQGSRPATYRTVSAAPGSAAFDSSSRAGAPRYAPSPAPGYASSSGATTSRGTVVLSSRPAPARIVPAPVAAPPAPVFACAPGVRPAAPVFQPPASEPVAQPVAAPSRASSPVFAPSTASLGASGRPINATCPVMLGNPVDPAVTAVHQGRVIAFSDYAARWKWNTDPDRYAVNLPRMASGSAGDSIPVFASGPSGASPFPAPTSEPLPLDPTLPSFESLPPVRSTPVLPPPGRLPAAATAVTSPRAMPPLVPAPAPRAPAVRAPATSSVTPPPAAGPSFEDLTHDEDEECPGGNCRLPGR